MVSLTGCVPSGPRRQQSVVIAAAQTAQFRFQNGHRRRLDDGIVSFHGLLEVFRVATVWGWDWIRLQVEIAKLGIPTLDCKTERIVAGFDS